MILEIINDYSRIFRRRIANNVRINFNKFHNNYGKYIIHNKKEKIICTRYGTPFVLRLNLSHAGGVSPRWSMDLFPSDFMLVREGI